MGSGIFFVTNSIASTASAISTVGMSIRARLPSTIAAPLIAAAVGAISGAAIVLGRRALIDIPTVLIALAVLAILFVTKKIPEPILILAAGAAGVLLYRGNT